jgi:alkylation response protein AidB-like acyl-CoA dehydrogenase
MIATDLSPEQGLFRETVRDFVRAEIEPIAAQLDEEARFPREVLAKMAPLGLLGIPVPEELGGAGADYLSYVLALEEIAGACASTALTLAAHTSLATMPIVRFGSEDLKRRYVPDLAAGRKLGAFALTESHSGSDAASLRTTARREGSVYVLDGSKQFITNGTHAAVYLVAARVIEAGGASAGIAVFVVERGYAGLRVGKKEDKLGLRASDTAALGFSGCRVPAANRLGSEGDPEGEGFKYVLRTLAAGRIGIGAMAVGIAQRALERALEHARTRRAFGKKLADLGAIQEKLADMGTGIHAARILVYDAARRAMAGRPFAKEASMAKLFASETANRVTREAIQILGASGFSRELPLERYFRDMKLLEIGEGTSEIQRIVIARELLGREAKEA